MSRLVFLAISAMALLLGCEQKDLQPDRSAPKTHVWQDQVNTLDKARAAGDNVERHGAEQAQQIEAQSR